MRGLATRNGWQGSTLHGPQVEMTLLTLLISLPLALLLQTAVPKELELVVLSTSVLKEQSKTDPTARNPYVLVGSSMRMVCRYRVSSEGRDYCAEKNSTRLTVQPVGRMDESMIRDRIVVIDNTSKCNLTVEFRNMSTDMEGQYACRDEVANQSDRRDVKVGDAPVVPRNIRVVYRPLHSIVLSLDPVMTGLDLNDPGTVWTVKYAWRNENKDCHKKPRGCKSLKDGLCRPCVIKLKHYSGCGQYTHFGILSKRITFHITVSNFFGNVTRTKTFNLLNWVQPSAVEELSVACKNQSSLNVTATPPKGLDESHYSLVAGSQYPVRLRWSVDLLSARNQSLQLEEGQEFLRKYGFVRNLEDDKAALSHTHVLAFPRSSAECHWKLDGDSCDRDPPNQYRLISDLPFPGYYYSVSVQNFARYPGEKVYLDLHSAYTQEAAPLEGPELHESFAYCDHSVVSAKACVNCVVYFKEIPRSKRGSARVNYTVTVELLNGDSLQHQGERCTYSTAQSTKAHGQNNSVLLLNLEAGGDYNVSMQAHNDAGPSPVTSRILQVHATPPPTAPQNIVLEKKFSASLWMYEVYWARSHREGVRYFVHYCNATSLQLQGQTALSSNQSMQPAEKTLNCVTNMVNTPVSDASTFSFEQSPRVGLTAAFFVSSVTPDGVSSGLQKVGCFYTRNTLPGEVKGLTVKKVDNNIHALRVHFFLPYGEDLNYEHGRPEFYAVGMIKLRDSVDDTCMQRCGSLMPKTSYATVELQPVDNLREMVSYDRQDLDAGSRYCVGVNLADRSRWFITSRWQCRVQSTAEPPADYISRIIPVLTGVTFALVLALLVCWCRNYRKKQKKKFGLKQSQLGIPYPLVGKKSEVVLSPGGQTLGDVELGLLAFGNPTHSCNGNVLTSHPSNFNSQGSGSSVVMRDGVDRYNRIVGTGDGPYPFLTPIRARTDEDSCDGSADGDDVVGSGSGEDSEGNDRDSEEDSSDDGSCSAQEPLISGSSGHCKPPQQSGPTVQSSFPALSASPVECRPLLFQNHAGREGERESSLAVDAGGAEKHPSIIRLVPGSDLTQDISSLSTAPPFSSDMTHAQPPCLLRSRALLHHQPDTTMLPENHDNSDLLAGQTSSPCIPCEQCPGATSQTLASGPSDPQQTATIGQYSIDDILQAAENSSSVDQRDVGAAGGREGTAEGEPLLLENILRAADLCPWKGGVSIQTDMAVHGAGVPDHRSHSSQGDSACDSSICTESVKETDAESESLTGKSVKETDTESESLTGNS